MADGFGAASGGAVPVAGTGGVEIEGWLMKPLNFEEGKKYPVVLEMHGGPAATYGHGFFHEFQMLCAAGIGVPIIPEHQRPVNSFSTDFLPAPSITEAPVGSDRRLLFCFSPCFCAY